MSWKRALQAGAKQQANVAGRAEPRGAKRLCVVCQSFGKHKIHGKWYCTSCKKEMGYS